MIKEAFQRFGKQAFQHAVFYHFDHSLRFELSGGDSRVDMFHQAFNRTLRISEFAFQGKSTLSVLLGFPGDSYLSNLSTFKELNRLQISIPKNHDKFSEWVEDDEWNRNYISFDIQYSDMTKFLFGKLGTELGISPSFYWDLYLYDMELGILLNPYDDRGLDVVGSNLDLKKKLFNEFHDWLLDYDMEKMKNWFG